MMTGTWKEYRVVLAFRDAMLSIGHDNISCRPWISTDGVVRNTLYVDMCSYVDGWYYTSTHSKKYTQVFSGLTAIPSTQTISDYDIDDYNDTSAITYTNTHFFEWDDTNKVYKNHIKILMTNSGDTPITVNSFKFRKSICVYGAFALRSSAGYVNALVLVYYLDTPIVIPPYSVATYTATIKTR